MLMDIDIIEETDIYVEIMSDTTKARYGCVVISPQPTEDYGESVLEDSWRGSYRVPLKDW